MRSLVRRVPMIPRTDFAKSLDAELEPWIRAIFCLPLISQFGVLRRIRMNVPLEQYVAV